MFMPIENYRHPFVSFASIACHVGVLVRCRLHKPFHSSSPFLRQISSLLIPLGLCGPASVAFFMIRRDKTFEMT